MKSRITLTQLRALVCIAEHGSYSEAALSTMQSQSTLSHAISELERSLDVQLLERGRHGAQLTRLGTRLLSHAKNAVDSVNALEQEVQLEQAALTGSIRIMSIRSVATHILPPIISGFMQRFPGITFEFLEEGDDDNLIEDAVRADRADIGILDSLKTNSGLLEFELTRDEYVLLQAKTKRKKSWADIRKQPYIMPLGGCSRHLQDVLIEQNLAFEPAFRIHDDSVILGMVGQGLGVSTLPRLAVEPLPADVVASSFPVPLERIIHVVLTRKKMRQPAVREFIQTIKANLPQ